MKRLERRRWDRQGDLLMEPKAFFGLFDPMGGAPEVQTKGDAAIVTVRGPLDQFACFWWDSYEAIKARVAAACESAAGTIVLRIDSPGGVVHGCFETAREIRAMCASAGKKLLAYVDGQASSAAYALACAAERILVPETGCVGSVGVINTRLDCTAYNAKDGFAFLITASGARKADGNPNVAISPEEEATIRATVDELAGKFFALVEELRGVPAKTIAALEAATLLGEPAVEAGLADAVMTFPELLEAIEGGALASNPKEKPMASKYSEAVAALKEAADGEDEEEAKKAKAALAALENEDDEEEIEAEEDPPPSEKVDAEGEDDEKDEAKAKASSGKASSKASTDARIADLERREAERERKAEAQERESLLASVTPDQRKRWAKKPLVALRDLVAEFKRAPTPLAAAATARGTQGAGEGGASPVGVTSLSPQASAMDRLFGLGSSKRGVVDQGTLQILGGELPREG